MQAMQYFMAGFFLVFSFFKLLNLKGFAESYVMQSVLNKKKIQCACLGAVFNLPMSTVTIIEDALMIVMSGIMILKMI